MDIPESWLDINKPTRPPPTHNVRNFFAGLIVGTAASAIYYKWIAQGDLFFVFGLIFGAKLLAAIIAYFIEDAWPFGLGIILSMPLGLLIFVGLCAANFKLY